MVIAHHVIMERPRSASRRAISRRLLNATSVIRRKAGHRPYSVMILKGITLVITGMIQVVANVTVIA